MRLVLGFVQNSMMKITHTDTTFNMSGKKWAGTYPLGELDKWLTFYRRQREDFPKSGNAYDVSIEGLEAQQRKLKAP